MPPPDDGNEFLPFVDLLRLHRVDDLTFRSIAQPFRPGADLPRAVGVTYGGHVYAQAAWAAAQTVAKGHLLYNISGNFILPGSPRAPFVYRVQKIRDGRSSSLRIVNVTQGESADVIFTCTSAFKTAEASPLAVQDEVDVWSRYAVVLDGRRKQGPGGLAPVAGMDVPWYLQHLAEGGRNDAFPGLEMRQPDMLPYNRLRHPLDRRHLMFYRPLGPLPSDPNCHLCAHLYASDRNGLYIVAKHLDVGDLYTQMGSLTHTIVFHGPPEDLTFGPTAPTGTSPPDHPSGAGRWFCREDRTDRAAGGRVTFHARVWAPSGAHVATAMQDGMTRTSEKPEATSREIEDVRARVAGWVPRRKL